jgi:hypothetical protein
MEPRHLKRSSDRLRMHLREKYRMRIRQCEVALSPGTCLFEGKCRTPEEVIDRFQVLRHADREGFVGVLLLLIALALFATGTILLLYLLCN